MKTYVCLMIDIKASKSYSIAQRNMIQKYMLEVMHCLNHLFQHQLVHEVVCSAGDEMQGVFYHAKDAWMYFRLMETFMVPVEIRGGIGQGAWTIRMEEVGSTYQDGPLFYAARTAIQKAHVSKLHRLCSEGFSDGSIDVLLNASYSLKQQQNLTQNLTMSYIECLYPFYDSSLSLDETLLLQLMNLKQQYYTSWNQVAVNIISQIDVKGISIHEETTNYEALVMVRNMSLNLAKVLVCTRQNADKLMKRGYIYQIRQLDYYVIKQLMKEES